MRGREGARKTNDPESTRKRILAAAVEGFSERGFAGTSLGDVAKGSGVQKSLIQYHFANKEGLWIATCLEAAAPALRALQGVEATERPPRVTELLELRFRTLQANPRLVRLLQWAGMDQAPVPPDLLKAVNGILGRAMPDKKKKRRELQRVFISAVCAMDGWFLYRESLAPAFMPDQGPEERDQAFLAGLLRNVEGEVASLREA